MSAYPPARSLRRCAAALSVLAAAGLSGCATAARPAAVVEVDAIRRAATPPGQSYRLEASNPELDQSSIQFAATARSVKAAMAAKGLLEAPEAAKAEFVVDLDFGVDGPVERWVKTYEPVFEYKLPEPIVLTRKLAEGMGGDTRYQEYTVQGPPMKVYTGDREVDVLTLGYEMHLTLIARRNLASGEIDTLWSVSASVAGPTAALAESLPMLVDASGELLGEDTQGPRLLKVPDTRDGAERPGN